MCLKKKYFSTIMYIFIIYTCFWNNKYLSASEYTLEINRIKEEIHAINRSILLKYYITLGKDKKWKYTRTLSQYETIGHHTLYYYQGIVRKYIITGGVPEKQFYIMQYYNTSGDLIFYRAFMANLEYIWSGYGYINNMSFIKINSISGEAPSKDETGKNRKYGEMPPEYFQKLKIFHLKTNEIPINIKKPIYIINKCRFVKPKKNENTIINANNVIIRSKPSRKSHAIGKLRIASRIKILEFFNKQEITPWGEFYWYKISFYNKIGYIFGAFIEPVEVEVK
jgi:hypothetical protein